jgi:hypothetical protein
MRRLPPSGESGRLHTGFWLEDAGFPYDQQFQVEVEAGRLVLQAV